MKIISYEYSDVNMPGWFINKIFLRNINLLIGLSASGKTRFLNTIFNLGVFIARENFPNPNNGKWTVEFEQQNDKYIYKIETNGLMGNDFSIMKETLEKNSKILIDRDDTKFVFNDIEIPKLSMKNTSITHLKEDKTINPVYQGFASIVRRRFFENEGGNLNQITTKVIQKKFIENVKDKKILLIDEPISIRLYILKKFFPKEYNCIIENLKSIFPFISEIKILDYKNLSQNIQIIGSEPIGPMPILCIKEQQVNQWIPYSELSSGMQKVILILTDIISMPKGSIYLIDEYENSLGINAINFLPPILCEYSKEIQFLVSSHHPYLINNISIKDWLIFHRKGTEVSFQYGESLLEEFGKSKQEQFFKIMNYPFFKDGIE